MRKIAYSINANVILIMFACGTGTKEKQDRLVDKAEVDYFGQPK